MKTESAILVARIFDSLHELPSIERNLVLTAILKNYYLTPQPALRSSEEPAPPSQIDLVEFLASH